MCGLGEKKIAKFLDEAHELTAEDMADGVPVNLSKHGKKIHYHLRYYEVNTK